MAIFSLSPSVEVKERDLTLIIPAVSTSIGAFSGVFRWGPVNQVISVDSERTLADIFQTPDDETARDFMTAGSFLAYSKHLKVTRVVGSAAKNASASTTDSAPKIGNRDEYDSVVTTLNDTKFIAKYPGDLGNSLKVSFADSESFDTWEYRELFGSSMTSYKTGSITNGSTTVTLADTSGLEVGMLVSGAGIPANTKIVSIDSATDITLSAAATADDANVSLAFTVYTGRPGTSAYVESKGGSNDEIHLVVVDEDGLWTGTAGTVLERYVGLSKARDAKNFSGANNYYAEVLNRDSRYVWFGGTHENADWGGLSSTNFSSASAPVSVSLTGGVSDNGSGVTTADRIAGYAPFAKAEEHDVNLVIIAGLDTADEQEILSGYVIENIAEVRKDCVVFISPPLSAVVDNTGNELQDIVSFRNRLNSSSYAVMDSGWKSAYDQYNDKLRWVPLAADIAGVCAYTDQVSDPWYSPAGYNRGFIKNVISLAYNPGSKAERDTLFVNAINPVVSQVGEGVVLYGDKTMQSKPSAFDRINVRRLFITVEKAIATAAKYQLFEFNDAFTRGRFVGMVEPFLREVQGRRGITDFKVVCDTSNNTPEVIDSNGFVADIYIKPARSINNILLNFIATPTGVSFQEAVVG